MQVGRLLCWLVTRLPWLAVSMGKGRSVRRESLHPLLPAAQAGPGQAASLEALLGADHELAG